MSRKPSIIIQISNKAAQLAHASAAAEVLTFINHRTCDDEDYKRMAKAHYEVQTLASELEELWLQFKVSFKEGSYGQERLDKEARWKLLTDQYAEDLSQRQSDY